MVNARILVAEDDSLTLSSLITSLARTGYSVTAVADSGEQALEAVRSTSPDLVLMSRRLRGTILGVDAADVIMSTLDTPVVFLTSYEDYLDPDLAIDTEPFGSVLKPIRGRDVSPVIELALASHEAEQRVERVRHAHRVTRRILRAIGRLDDDGEVLQAVCDFLVDEALYQRAWISMETRAGARAVTCSSGFTVPLPDRELPACGKKAISTKGILGDVELRRVCLGCPVTDKEYRNGRLVGRLVDDGEVRVVLGVVLPPTKLPDEEEVSLYRDLVDDLSYALDKRVAVTKGRRVSIGS